jgi:hypothetical protein
MNSGIYIIKNLINEKFYIGSTINLKQRKYDHFKTLINNKHCNRYLQRSYNKYGKENFRFVVLEYVIDPEILLKREQWWLDIFYDKKHCYNINPTAGSRLGVKHTEKAKKKMSKAKKGKILGFKYSEEIKLKNAISSGAKPFLVHTKEGFFIGKFINQSECARKLGIDSSYINKCLKNKRRFSGGYAFKYVS